MEKKISNKNSQPYSNIPRNQNANPISVKTGNSKEKKLSTSTQNRTQKNQTGIQDRTINLKTKLSVEGNTLKIIDLLVKTNEVENLIQKNQCSKVSMSLSEHSWNNKLFESILSKKYVTEFEFIDCNNTIKLSKNSIQITTKAADFDYCVSDAFTQHFKNQIKNSNQFILNTNKNKTVILINAQTINLKSNTLTFGIYEKEILASILENNNEKKIFECDFNCSDSEAITCPLNEELYKKVKTFNKLHIKINNNNTLLLKDKILVVTTENTKTLQALASDIEDLTKSTRLKLIELITKEKSKQSSCQITIDNEKLKLSIATKKIVLNNQEAAFLDIASRCYTGNTFEVVDTNGKQFFILKKNKNEDDVQLTINSKCEEEYIELAFNALQALSKKEPQKATVLFKEDNIAFKFLTKEKSLQVIGSNKQNLESIQEILNNFLENVTITINPPSKNQTSNYPEIKQPKEIQKNNIQVNPPSKNQTSNHPEIKQPKEIQKNNIQVNPPSKNQTSNHPEIKQPKEIQKNNIQVNPPSKNQTSNHSKIKQPKEIRKNNIQVKRQRVNIKTQNLTNLPTITLVLAAVVLILGLLANKYFTADKAN